MKSTLAAGCAVAAALLSAVACGAAAPAAHLAERAKTAAAPAAPAAAACPVRHAWADEVTATGRIAWQDSLPTDPGAAGISQQPLAASGEGVFAEENAVYAIRLRDGHRQWRRAFSTKVSAATGAVYGLWRGAPGTVVVLTGQVSDDARLTGLSLTTGAVQWSLQVPGRGLRRIYLVNPATGKVRWSVAAFATAEDDSSGQLVETATSVIMPQANVGAPPGDERVVARSAASGRVLWSLPLGTNGSAGLHLARLKLASGQAVAVTMSTGSGISPRTKLTVHQLATGLIVATAALPEFVSAPLTVHGGSILAQPDSLTCAIAYGGATRG